jgi:hypothetical protein
MRLTGKVSTARSRSNAKLPDIARARRVAAAATLALPLSALAINQASAQCFNCSSPSSSFFSFNSSNPCSSSQSSQSSSYSSDFSRFSSSSSQYGSFNLPSPCATNLGVQHSATNLANITTGVVADRQTEVRSQLQDAFIGSIPVTAYADPNGFYALISKDGPYAAPAVAATNVRPAVWVRGFGDYTRDNTTGGAPVGTFGVLGGGYRAGTLGVLGGVEAQVEGITSKNDGLLFGGLGGYVESDVRFAGSPNTARFTGGVAGIAGTYFNGGYFFDAQFKAEFLSLNYNNNFAFLAGVAPLTQVSVLNLTVMGRTGYRFNFANGYFFEPFGEGDFTQTNFGGNGVLLGLQNGHTTRGEIGARAGAVFTYANLRIEPSVTGGVWHVFEVSNNFAAAFAAPGIIPAGLNNGRITYGEVTAGVSVLASNGVSGFVKGETRFGDLTSYGGKAGVRVRF